MPGPATERMGEAAREAAVYLAVGVVERDSTYSGGTLFCTLLYFGADGTLLASTEAQAHGGGAPDLGRGRREHAHDGPGPIRPCGWPHLLGELQPLARMAMYGKGVEIYLAPTADYRSRWQGTLQHIALEGRCFVLGCNQYVTSDMYPDDLEIAGELESWPETLCPRWQCHLRPSRRLPGRSPLRCRRILTAELDMGAVARREVRLRRRGALRPARRLPTRGARRRAGSVAYPLRGS